MKSFPLKRFFCLVSASLLGVATFSLILLVPILFHASYRFYHYYVQRPWIQISAQSLGYARDIYQVIRWAHGSPLSLSSAEADHIHDVTSLFHAVQMTAIFAWIAFLLFLLILIITKHRPLIVKWVFRSSLIALIVLLAVGSALLLDFSSLFNGFHMLFFPQGNRTFDSSSLLITLFPSDFFMTAAKSSLSVSICLSFALLALSLLPRYRHKRMA